MLLPGRNGWRLPQIAPQENVEVPEVSLFKRAMQAQYGLPVTTLYAVRLPDKTLPGAVNIFTVERHESAWEPPPGGRWVGRSEMANIRLALPTHERALNAWFAGAEGEPSPAFHIPWWHSGWFDRAAAWGEEQIKQQGRTLTAPVEQMRSAYTAAILRLPTNGGDFYLKAVPPPLAQEVSLMPALVALAPELCPTIIAHDQERRWLLMRDIGGAALGAQTPMPDWEAVIRAYAQLQVQSVPHTALWRKAGCFDWRLERISEAMETMFAEMPARLAGLPNSLTSEEMAALSSRVPELHSLCAALADCGIPPALDHGDLHAGNVRVTAAGPVFYDWSHSSVTHPFFSLMDLLADDDWFPQQPQAKNDLRDLYLEAWEEYAPPAHLAAAFALALRLYRLYRALHQSRLIDSYRQMLGGSLPSPETASGNSLQYMQWWLAAGLRNLLHSQPEHWQ